MNFKVMKCEAVEVQLNTDLFVKLEVFLKERKLSIEKVLSDAIPLFVVFWDEKQRDRLALNVDSLLCAAMKSESVLITLFFKKESFKALKEFSKRKLFDNVSQIINSSLNLFLFIAPLVEQHGFFEINLRNPKGKLIIESPDYLKK